MNNKSEPSAIQNTDLFNKSRRFLQKAVSVVEISIQKQCPLDISKDYKIDSEGYSYSYSLKPNFEYK
jgi:hypothetical protein